MDREEPTQRMDESTEDANSKSINHGQNMNDNSDAQECPAEQTQAAYKDHGWAWAVVAASFFSNFLADGIVFSAGVLFVAFLEEFQDSKSHTSVIATILVVFVHITGLFAGTACDKFGFRPVAIIGSVVAAVGYGISGLATNIIHLYFTIGVLGGIGIGLMYFPSISCVQHYFDKRRSLAMGIAVSGTGVGTFAMAPLVELLLGTFGWRIALVFVGGILLLGIPLALIYKPTPDTHIAKPKGTSSEEGHSTFGTKNKEMCSKACAFMSAIKQYFQQIFDFTLLKNSLVAVFIGSIFLMQIGFFVPFSFIPDHAKSLGISAQDATFLISIIGITNTINRIVVGFIGDLKCVNRLVLLSSSLMLKGLTILLVPFCNNYVLLAVDMGVLGMLSGCIISLYPVVLRDLVGLKTFNRGLGLMLATVGIAQAFHPLSGAMYDWTGNYDLTFFTGGGILCVAAIPLIFITVVQRMSADGDNDDEEINTASTHIPNETQTTKL